MIGILISIKVCDPVLEVIRAFERNIDRVVKWEVADETFCVVICFVNGVGVNEPTAKTLPLKCRILFMSTVGID